VIGALRCKAGVEFAVIAPGGFRILGALEATSRILEQDITITAGTNDHATGRHPFGEAFDVSVQGMTPATIKKMHRHLQQLLGDNFTVLYEVPATPQDTDLRTIAYVNADATAPHFHIQVRKASEYPPRNSGALFG
jgi:hypothetical protein